MALRSDFKRKFPGCVISSFVLTAVIPIFNTRRIELLQLDNYQYTQLNIPEEHLLSGDIDWLGVNDLLVFRTRDASTGPQ